MYFYNLPSQTSWSLKSSGPYETSLQTKHHWRWWNSSWAISSPERWYCESAALNMPANLENSAVATGLEKVSFHSNPNPFQSQFSIPTPVHGVARSQTQLSSLTDTCIHTLWSVIQIGTMEVMHIFFFLCMSMYVSIILLSILSPLLCQTSYKTLLTKSFITSYKTLLFYC